MSTYDATPNIYNFELIKCLTRQFGKDTRGNVALMFGLLAIPLFVGAGMAIDISRHGYHQRQLASAVDAAALAAARLDDGASQSEMLAVAQRYLDLNYTERADLRGNQINLSVSLADNVVTVNADVDVPTTITTLIGVYNMPAQVTSEVTKGVLGTEIALVSSDSDGGGDSGGGTGSGEDGVTITTTVNDSASSITVAIEREWTPYFAQVFFKSSPPISASATAQLVGTGKVCILALDETSAGALSLTKKANLEALQCGVYSNSTHTQGIVSTGTSLLKALLYQLLVTRLTKSFKSLRSSFTVAFN